MLNSICRLILCFVFINSGHHIIAQDTNKIQVKTLFNLNASGGVTSDHNGNIYISDFGKQLGKFDSITRVFKWNPRTEELSVFADGFQGASGACFDHNGNFYQSNPFSHSISKIDKSGSAKHDWCVNGLKLPVGLEADKEGNIFVSNCGKNEIGKISPEGNYETFAGSEFLKCPNGLTQDNEGNLYACNFGDGKIIKITPDGKVSVLVELTALTGGPNPVGNGHLVYSNGWLFVTTIGPGTLYRVGLDGSKLKIAGKHSAFENRDGDANTATFNKPNGVAASISGDTLYINVSDPSWISNPRALYPAKVMMVTGICSLPNSGCE